MPNYKYKLHYYLRQLSGNDYEIAMEFLPNVCHVEKETFRAWIYIKANESRTIQIDSLQKIATFFEVSVEDMLHKKTTKDEILEKLNIFKLNRHVPHNKL